jgi:hypothetical protein
MQNPVLTHHRTNMILMKFKTTSITVMSVPVNDVDVCKEMRLWVENDLFQDFRYIWKESRQSNLMQMRN